MRMHRNKPQVNYRLLFCSFVFAFAASIVPLPPPLDWYRPEWVTLVLIYWCSFLPTTVSVGSGWLLGLLQDSLRGALLGQNALAMTLVAYFSVQLHQRFRLFPLWQQSLCVFMMIACAQMLVLWVHGMISPLQITWFYWLPSLTSMLIWPLVFAILQHYRREWRVVATK